MLELDTALGVELVWETLLKASAQEYGLTWHRLRYVSSCKLH